MTPFLLSAREYDLVARIARAQTGVGPGMEELLGTCGALLPHPVWLELRDLEFASDVARLRQWVTQLLVLEPVSEQINGIYFGLAEVPIGVPEHTTCRISVIGTDAFDAADEQCLWAAEPSYRPLAGTTDSTVLEAIYVQVQAAGQDVAAVGEYVLGLGYACLAIRDVCDSLRRQVLAGASERGRGIAVGFDCGDAVLLGSLQTDGWHF